jgi:hypothetical protein
LRYVSKDMPVESRDINLRVDCLKALRDALKTKATEFGCPSEKVDPLVDQLDSILAMIRYVRSGDILQPEDHNRIVDALRKARDILGEIESWCRGLSDQLDVCKSDLASCQAQLSRCLAIIEKAVAILAGDIIPTSLAVYVETVSPNDITVGMAVDVGWTISRDIQIAFSVEIKTGS